MRALWIVLVVVALPVTAPAGEKEKKSKDPCEKQEKAVEAVQERFERTIENDAAMLAMEKILEDFGQEMISATVDLARCTLRHSPPDEKNIICSGIKESLQRCKADAEPGEEQTFECALSEAVKSEC